MDKNECEDKYSESETEEHLNGKRDLYEWIKKQDGVTSAVLEGWLPETKQRPDIMFKYDGKQYVIEYQCSPIASEYVERHELYKTAGIIDIWIAGYEKYFKSNSRHKYIEDYIEGYYNPIKKDFYIGVNTEQGKFCKKMNIRNVFPLMCFGIYDSTILHKTFKNNDFSEKYSLHLSRINANEKYDKENCLKTEKRISALSNYVAKFNGTFGKYHYYSNKEHTVYYIYGNNDASFYKKEFNVKKNGFYKRIYDIRKGIELDVFLNHVFFEFEDICNYVWHFYSHFSAECIEINISLLNRFRESFTISYDEINMKNQEMVKKILFPHMKLCLEKGLYGDGCVRIMEVRDN